ncbi:hypothetical protein LW893_01610 [Parvimonas micra]|jgi:hypothetical protein|uniref:hypothetical protein n=1 Tax=Parvimonas micra TaxID=33033 RepID=UPI001E35D3E7|nr:hypothetical protein [Parvimonas micra]MCE3019638.1 hypothetical protein [Parvimonas micra]
MNALLDKDTRIALEYNFLYLKDSVAFDIFISSLSIEQRGFNVRFRQAIFNKISKSLDVFYKNRSDKEYIKSAVQKLVYDDINRLEIVLAVDSYIYGKKSNVFANEVENYFLLNYPNLKISKKQKLIVRKLSSKDYRFRNRVINNVIDYYNLNKMFEEKTNEFFENVIKEYIFNLNNYIVKQLKLEFKGNNYYVLQKEKFLTKKDLENLYNHIYKVFMEHLHKTSRIFIWYGLNDKVTSRYKN